MRLEDIYAIGVVGAGAVGQGVAVDFLRAGYRVLIYNRGPESSRRAVDAIRAALTALVRQGALTPEAAAAAGDRLQPSLDVVQSGANADFVVEALREDLELKREMLRRIEEVGEPDMIIASTTCGLTTGALVERMEYPERLLIARFQPPTSSSAPVPVVPGPRTAPEVVETSLALFRRIGKAPVLEAPPSG